MSTTLPPITPITIGVVGDVMTSGSSHSISLFSSVRPLTAAIDKDIRMPEVQSRRG